MLAQLQIHQYGLSIDGSLLHVVEERQRLETACDKGNGFLSLACQECITLGFLLFLVEFFWGLDYGLLVDLLF